MYSDLPCYNEFLLFLQPMENFHLTDLMDPKNQMACFRIVNGYTSFAWD